MAFDDAGQEKKIRYTSEPFTVAGYQWYRSPHTVPTKVLMAGQACRDT